MKKKMIISIENLEEAREKYFLLKDIRESLQHVYDTYHSPSFDKAIDTKNRNESDPVTKALSQIEGIEATYEIVYRQFMEYWYFVSKKIKDTEINCVITSHYFCGLPWNKTGSYGAKKKVYAYISDHYSELNSDQDKN